MSIYFCQFLTHFSSSSSILADLVLKDKIVVYDLAGQRIGWANYDCKLQIPVFFSLIAHIERKKKHKMLLCKLVIHISRILSSCTESKQVNLTRQTNKRIIHLKHFPSPYQYHSFDPCANEYYHCLTAGSMSVNVTANTNGTGSVNTKPRYVSSSLRNEPLKLMPTTIVMSFLMLIIKLLS